MGQNGIRDLEPQNSPLTQRRTVGEVVTDRQGTRYVVVNVGIRYLSVRPEEGGEERLLKVIDHIPTGERVKT